MLPLSTGGNRTTVTDPKNATWTYEFNAHNRQSKLTQPDGRIEQLFYDPNGNLVKKIDGNGAQILYEHDALNRLTKRDYPTGTDVTFTYDAMGRRLTMTDGTGTTTYQYDALGRPLSVTAPIAGGKTVSYTYTAVGRRATMTDPDAGVTSYAWDAANRLTSLTNPFNETTTFTQDAIGRLTRQDNANGTHSTWTFDDGGRVSKVESRKSNDAVILSMAYTRDNVGKPTQIVDQLLLPDDQTYEAGTWTFNYDGLNRLTLEKRTGAHPYWYEYTMDGAGNRTQFVEKDGQGNVTGTTDATYSADNRLLTYGNSTYTWDQNGNMLSKTTNGVTVSYDWDYENKMVALWNGHNLQFTYNGDGLRQSKTVDSTTTRYVYSGVRLIKELDAAGATQVTYTLAPTGGEWHPLLSDRKAGASRLYAFDALGTTRALTGANEVPTAVFTDDAWGNTLSASDPSATPHQYVGRLGYYADEASGLQLLTQRYYDDAVGRFVSEDPIRAQHNWIAYVGDHPSVWADADGTNMLDPHEYAYNASKCREGTSCSNARCGPDVTPQVRDAISRTKAAFASWGKGKRIAKCVSFFELGLGTHSYSMSWDIAELYLGGESIKSKGCPRCKRCNGTVTIDRRCYNHYSANYVILGVMNRLCHDEAIIFYAGPAYPGPVIDALSYDYSVEEMVKLINLWKRLAHGGEAAREAADWARVGWEGWPGSGPAPQANIPESECGKCSEGLAGKFTVQWGWDSTGARESIP